MLTQEVHDWEPKLLLPDGIRSGEHFFRKLLDSLYDGVFFVDTHRKILFWNVGAEQLSGYAAKDVVGTHCYANILNHVDGNGCQLCKDSCPLVHTINTGLPASNRVFLRHKDRRRVAVDVHVMPLRDDRGEIIGGVEVFRDASSFVALENAYDNLRQVAEKDPLTDVANRRHLDRMLDSQLQLLKRTGVPFSAILVDIDHFKKVNDTWGHPVGDKALIGFSRGLTETCRQTDIIGRWGGDEFMTILPGQRLDSAAAMAERLRAATANSAPEEIGSHGMTGSFGVTEAILGDTADRIIKRVDEALYQAKSLGRNRVEISRPAELFPTPAVAVGDNMFVAVDSAVGQDVS